MMCHRSFYEDSVDRRDESYHNRKVRVHFRGPSKIYIFEGHFATLNRFCSNVGLSPNLPQTSHYLELGGKILCSTDEVRALYLLEAISVIK